LIAASDKLEEDRGMTLIAVNYDLLLNTVPETKHWNMHCNKGLLDEISSRKRYNFDSAADLLRVIRNKAAHYYELAQPIRDTLGPYPDGYLSYFEERFPSLFICTFEYFRHACHDPAFADYF